MKKIKYLSICIVGLKLGPILFPEVDKFSYWVDICVLDGFLWTFSGGDCEKRFIFV